MDAVGRRGGLDVGQKALGRAAHRFGWDDSPAAADSTWPAAAPVPRAASWRGGQGLCRRRRLRGAARDALTLTRV
jgi:hypothetical protein